MSTSQNGRRQNQAPLSKPEALILLRSAVGYCLEAGFTIGARNGGNGLILSIAGAEVLYHNDRADFVPQADVPQANVPQADVPAYEGANQ